VAYIEGKDSTAKKDRDVLTCTDSTDYIYLRAGDDRATGGLAMMSSIMASAATHFAAAR
jgi:hypothetical protein